MIFSSEQNCDKLSRLARSFLVFAAIAKELYETRDLGSSKLENISVLILYKFIKNKLNIIFQGLAEKYEQ